MTSLTKCAKCGKDATTKCAQCRKVAYCDVTCQRADWKQHKKVCFPDGSTCKRCLESITDRNLRCIVPHPFHLLEDHLNQHSSAGHSWQFYCKACERMFTRTTSEKLEDDWRNKPITTGPEYCFSGSHTIKDLPEGCNRKAFQDAVVLYSGPNLQSEIDAIPSIMPHVRILTIVATRSSREYFKFDATLNIPLPQLKILRLINVHFEKVHLNPTLTPEIEQLYMQNIPVTCDIKVLLPELKDFEMHYYGPVDNDGWFHEMLACATKLESFNTYKLRVGPELCLASNELRTVRLERAELLHDLSIYAPKLEELFLVACFNLWGEVDIMESHPNFTTPPGRPSMFKINLKNANVSNATDVALRSHPRVSRYIGMEDERDNGCFRGFGQF